ncbi:hypothetical protein JHK85_008733 [Glycine max]|nr:hypothetical protein JHK85_008733 [Glycine max]
MEPNDNQLTSFFHHHHQQHQHHQPPPPPQTTASPTNGLLPNADGSHILYPHSVASAVSSQLEPAKRKRGRPRKYGTPEQALAAKKAATTLSHSFSVDKKPHSPTFPSSKKSHSFALGNAGQGFTPHVISVAAGEDVGQKIMLFMQQSRREMCILSASGSISNASLRQPATSGGSIAYELAPAPSYKKIDLHSSVTFKSTDTKRNLYENCLLDYDYSLEGRFEIISLTGSYVRNELGTRTGGLSVCLSNTDGQIIGGGVGGPLKAAGPVQVISERTMAEFVGCEVANRCSKVKGVGEKVVDGEQFSTYAPDSSVVSVIVGTFFIDNKKDTGAGVKGDISASKLPSPVGEPVSSLGFRQSVDSPSGNPIRGNDEHQAMGGSHFMIQQLGLHGTPPRSTDWGHPDSRNTGFELTGRIGHGAHQSPENGGYEQIPD